MTAPEAVISGLEKGGIIYALGEDPPDEVRPSEADYARNDEEEEL